MDDYTEDSLVQVFDSRLNTYAEFKGMDAIKQMFVDLFAALRWSLLTQMMQIEPDYNGVFFVWSSLSHPKASETFVFDDSHKIVRQNIVVQTKVDDSKLLAVQV